jgi:hypothetical protein
VASSGGAQQQKSPGLFETEHWEFFSYWYICENLKLRTRFIHNFESLNLFCAYLYTGSRGSSGSIVSDCGLDNRAIGVRSPAGQRIFPLASVSRPALGPTQPPVLCVPGVLSPGVKARPGRDTDHSPTSVPRSRMSRSYTSFPPQAPPGV